MSAAVPMYRRGVPGDVDVIVIGAGGHAAVCIDVMTAAGIDVAGVVDAAPSSLALPVPWLGDERWLDEELGRRPGAAVFVAIGSNRARADVQARVESRGAVACVVVSPHAVVAAGVRIGAGSIVMPGAVIMTRSALGRGVIVNTAASVDHDGALGDFAHIAPGTHLAGDVTVHDGAFLGVGVSVVPGRTIGAWSTIGAGAAVVDDVPPGVTAVGVPARVVPG